MQVVIASHRHLMTLQQCLHFLNIKYCIVDVTGKVNSCKLLKEYFPHVIACLCRSIYLFLEVLQCRSIELWKAAASCIAHKPSHAQMKDLSVLSGCF